MKVIALNGWKFSGKDTLANYIIEKYGFIRTAFADPLKDSVAEEFGIDRASLDDPKRKEAPLLDMPVNPQDAFSETIAELLLLEFAHADGTKYTGSLDIRVDYYNKNVSQLYWTPRALAILKGSANRSVKSNFWVQKAIQDIWGKHDHGHPFHVITDMRYRSEMSQLKEAFGDKVQFVRINRFESSPSKDPSERDLDHAQFDHYVNNTGLVELAYEQMDRIVK